MRAFTVYLYRWDANGIEHYTTARNRKDAIATWKRNGVSVPSTAKLSRS